MLKNSPLCTQKSQPLGCSWRFGQISPGCPMMAHCLNYRQCLASKPANSLLGLVVSEMSVMAQNGQDCWLTRANKMAELLQTPNVKYSSTSGRYLLKHIQCKFQIFWRDEITSSRVGPDGEQHNKLLTYSSFKSNFATEPFITMVRNRNQRCHLSYRLLH